MYTKEARTVPVFIYITNIFMVFDTGKSETIHCLQCKGEECDDTNFNTFNLTRTHCYQDYTKCATFLQKNKVAEKRCLKSEEAYSCDLEFPKCQSCDGDHCNTEYLKRPLCYVCNGENCTLARSNHNLDVVACRDVDARCISIIYPADNANNSMKNCLNGKDYTKNYNKCFTAPAINGFCRICKGHLCNSVENNFKVGDPIAQQQCYHCTGKNCTNGNNNLILDKEACSRHDAQCISVLYPKNAVEKNVKGCFYGKDDPKNNWCVQAFNMGGFCRICNDRLCNMLLPQPTKLRCYHCLGTNCTMAKSSSLDLGTVECFREDTQCISVIFPVNNKNVKKNMKSCFGNDHGRVLNLCANAAEMGGFCRICSGALCNSLENNFQTGDPIPRPNKKTSSEKSSKKSRFTLQPNQSSRLILSSALLTNMLIIYLYVT